MNILNKAIRNGLIFNTFDSSYFIFEYKGARYITSDDFESEIFLYQANTDQKFLVVGSLQKNMPLMDIIYKKYYESMENGHYLDYEEIIENELLEISKKRQQHIEVMVAMNDLVGV